MPPKRKRPQGPQAARPDLNKRSRKAVQASRLLDLPPELRDHIYGFLLPSRIRGAVFVQASGTGTSKAHHVSSYRPQRLSQVCRTIRAEISGYVSRRSHCTAKYVHFLADDFNFSALEAYLSLVNRKSDGGLGGFKSTVVAPGMTPETPRTLIVHLALSKRWCEAPEMKHFTSWAKFVRTTANASETEDIAEYRFEAVQDKELAASTMQLLTRRSHGHGKEWTDIGNAFLRWLRYDGSEKVEKWFAAQVLWKKELDAGFRYLREDYFNGMEEDGGEALRAPDNLQEEGAPPSSCYEAFESERRSIPMYKRSISLDVLISSSAG
ncbi:hypothetical protein B0A55_09419 [Friedmanniomyces simplex]|uniref:F-box domain-containing protein n=1 Tax=Friedmanniomyces simplex TaxID=329884 RepID=A0A4U0WZF6_9PEZI|nr:hypothetical protein B0A55_09419 [Friedmanniomyces simplex]